MSARLIRQGGDKTTAFGFWDENTKYGSAPMTSGFQAHVPVVSIPTGGEMC